MRFALLAALVLSCAHAPAATPDSFARFVDEYFAARYAFDPSDATDIGFHQYDDQLEDRSHARIEARVNELRRFGERLAALDRAAMPFDDQIDAQVIENQIQGALLELEVIRGWERNPMVYAAIPGDAINSLMKRSFAPAADRLRSAIARMESIPNLFAAARTNLRNPPREFTELAIRMTKGAVGFFHDSAAMWARQAAGDDAKLLARFEAANAKVIAATRDYLDWLQKELLPQSHGNYAIGADTFLKKLRYDDMIDEPLEKLLARGQAQLEKDYAAFVETARKIDPSKTPAEVFRSLEDEHPAADDLIPSVRRSVEAAREFVVAHHIVTVPSEVRVKVEETPPFERSGSFASMDTPGPFETRATEAFYYITPVEKDWDEKHVEEHLRAYNKYVVGMINVHEAYPGHYLEFLWAPRFPTKTRKLAHSSSNSEGWAHYAEQMMIEQGFGDGDPKMRLAQLSEALLRDCRYVVGIQLHTAGWTVEQGAKLFVDKGFQEPANALEEARRGAYNPTYLYYTYGKLEIQDLAREYMARKGATLQQFHDAFVAQGALPVPLVRKILFH